MKISASIHANPSRLSASCVSVINYLARTPCCSPKPTPADPPATWPCCSSRTALQSPREADERSRYITLPGPSSRGSPGVPEGTAGGRCRRGGLWVSIRPPSEWATVFRSHPISRILGNLVSDCCVTNRSRCVTTRCMSKPPTSVRSIRLTEESWEWLAASAKGRGLTVNGFVVYLVNATRSGLNCSPSSEPPRPKPPPRTQPEPVKVPVYTRPRFNPQPKKGK